MLYPVTLTKDDNDTYLVDFPDVPEAHTFGDSIPEALERAVDALLTALDGYIAERIPVPRPSRAGRYGVEVPPLDVAKLELHETMRQKRISKYRLGKMLGWHSPQVDRVLQLRYQSQFKQIEQALEAVGKKVVVRVTDAA